MLSSSMAMRWCPDMATDFKEGFQQLGVPVVVKNTFLDLEDRELVAIRHQRSSSVPCGWRCPPSGTGRRHKKCLSTASTASCDDGLSDDGSGVGASSGSSTA